MRLFFVALAVSFAMQCALASQSKELDDLIPALVLKQKHFYWGDTETIVCLDGIRINNKGRMFYSLVASSPKWDVTVYRNDDKTYLKQSLSEFEVAGLVNNFVVNKQARLFGTKSAETKVKINGITVTQIVHGPHLYQYLPLAGYASKPVEQILYATYKLPTNNGVPIKLVKHRNGLDWMTGINDPGSRKVLLETIRVEKTKVPRSIFIPPQNYKLSRSMQEVLMSKVSRDASGDLEVLIGGKK